MITTTWAILWMPSPAAGTVDVDPAVVDAAVVEVSGLGTAVELVAGGGSVVEPVVDDEPEHAAMTAHPLAAATTIQCGRDIVLTSLLVTPYHLRGMSKL
jgi:hypothetical protein